MVYSVSAAGPNALKVRRQGTVRLCHVDLVDTPYTGSKSNDVRRAIKDEFKVKLDGPYVTPDI